MEAIVLRTARLELSAPRTEDVDAITAACQDPLIGRFTTVPTPYRREHAEEFIAKTTVSWAEGTEAVWVIREAGGFSGMVGIHRIGRGDGELGYWLAPDARGRGLLTEAAAAVVDWALAADGLGLVRLEWRAVVGNVASARVAQRLGFRYEGLSRRALVNSAGVRSDGWIAGLLPEDDRAPQPWPALDA